MVTIEKNKGPSLFKSIDWFLIAVVLLINLFGLFAVRTVSILKSRPDLFTKQLIASIIGIALMVFIMMLDYKDFRVLSIIAYIGTVGLLLFVLIAGIGKEEKGMSGWIDMGPFTFQPSELGKITLSIVVAVFLERIKQGNGGINYLWLCGSAGGLIALVLLQPDFGTSVVYMFMLACMIFVFGLPYRIILIGLGTAIVALPLLWFGFLEKAFKSFQINRILSFFNPEAYASSGAFQVRMAIRAIGCGGLTGTESGVVKVAKSVPEVHTDSIFAIIGEKWGFIGSVIIVVLFVAFLIRCLYISRFAKDIFGAYIVIGLMAMFFFHFVENVCMNIGMLPVTGIPLPFISSGGSSVIVNYIAVGIVVSISMRRQRPMFEV